MLRRVWQRVNQERHGPHLSPSNAKEPTPELTLYLEKTQEAGQVLQISARAPTAPIWGNSPCGAIFGREEFFPDSG
jgi:hypothetical protein